MFTTLNYKINKKKSIQTADWLKSSSYYHWPPYWRLSANRRRDWIFHFDFRFNNRLDTISLFYRTGNPLFCAVQYRYFIFMVTLYGRPVRKRKKPCTAGRRGGGRAVTPDFARVQLAGAQQSGPSPPPEFGDTNTIVLV